MEQSDLNQIYTEALEKEIDDRTYTEIQYSIDSLFKQGKRAGMLLNDIGNMIGQKINTIYSNFCTENKIMNQFLFKFDTDSMQVQAIEFKPQYGQRGVLIPKFVEQAYVDRTEDGIHYFRESIFKNSEDIMLIVANGLKDTQYLCYGMRGKELYLDIDMANVVNANSMFGESDIEYLDLGQRFTTNLLESTNSMFYQCNKLKAIKLGNNFNTDSLQDAAYMFMGCRDLEVVDLGPKFTANVVKVAENMFNGCYKIKEFKASESFLNNLMSDKKNSTFKDAIPCLSIISSKIKPVY